MGFLYLLTTINLLKKYGTGSGQTSYSTLILKGFKDSRLFIEFDSDNNFTGRTTWNNLPEDEQACVFPDSVD